MSTSHGPDNSNHADLPDPADPLHVGLRAAFEHEERLLAMPTADEAVSRFHARRRVNVSQGKGEAGVLVETSLGSASFALSHSMVRARSLGSRTLRGGIGLSLAVLMSVVAMWAYNGAPATKLAERHYETHIGQLDTLTLSDGTHVILAPETRLDVAAGFNGETRHVFVRGEAYFNIARASSAPFLVDAGTARTRVLGTEFAVRRYPEDDETQVVVKTGRVVVGSTLTDARRTTQPDVVLGAGMVGHVTDSVVVAATAADIHSFISWSNGEIAFDDVPVPQVLTVLHHWYGITFRLTDSTLAHQHLSATLRYRETADMLTALKTLLDVTMTFDGTTATLSPRRTPVHSVDRNDATERLMSPEARSVGR